MISLTPSTKADVDISRVYYSELNRPGYVLQFSPRQEPVRTVCAPREHLSLKKGSSNHVLVTEK